MSLGADSADDVLDAAVKAVIDLGALVVTASGNFNNGLLPLAQMLLLQCIAQCKAGMAV